MTVEDAEGDASESKGGRWNRLRNKLLPTRRHSSDHDAGGPGFDDLSDFLPAQRPIQENKRPLGPKLDTASATKWPKAADVLQLKREQPPDETLPPFRYQKPRRRPNLIVDFVENYAEVIGIGGEDSEEPVTAVAQSKRTVKRPLPSRPRQRSGVDENLPGTYQPPDCTNGSQGQGLTTPIYGDQRTRPVHEGRRDLRKPSPGHTPGAPYVAHGEHSPPRRGDYFGSLGVGSQQDDSQIATRSRAHSDAPSLTISGPENARPRHGAPRDAPPVLPALRPEEDGFFSHTGYVSVWNTDSRGTSSKEQRRHLEAQPFPKRRADPRVEQRSRETSLADGSTPGTGGSMDSGVFQAPQYPISLSANPPSSRAGGKLDGETRTRSPRWTMEGAAILPPQPPKQQDGYPLEHRLGASRLEPEALAPFSTYSPQRILVQEGPSHGPDRPSQTSTSLNGPVRSIQHQRLPSDTLSPPIPQSISRSASPYSQSSQSDRSESSPQPRPRPQAGPSSVEQAQAPAQTQVDSKRCNFKCNIQSFTIDALPSGTKHALAQLPHWRRLQVFETPPVPDSDETIPTIVVIVFDPRTSYTDSAIQSQHFRLEPSASSPSSSVHRLTILSEPSPLRKVRPRSSAAPNVGEQAQAQLIAECSDIVRTQETMQSYTFLSSIDMAGLFEAISGSTITFIGTAHVKPPKKPGLLVRQLRDHPVVAQVCVASRKGHTTRLAAFLDDGRALKVDLHAWDMFEEAELKDCIAAVKLVGVKSCFADRWVMSNGTTQEDGSEHAPERDGIRSGKSFLPVDMQQQPDLNEDVTIGFVDEGEKQRFARALPAEVIKPKGFTLMRRI